MKIVSKRVARFARSGFVFLLSALTLLTLAASPAILFVVWFLATGYINNPKDEIVAERFLPGTHDVSWRLWRVPWKGLGGGEDTFALQLVSFRRHKEVQVFGADKKPLEIVWRDASNLEIAVPNLAFVGDHPREAFGVTVHVRFVPDDPEARRKHFEDIERRSGRRPWPPGPI